MVSNSKHPRRKLKALLLIPWLPLAGSEPQTCTLTINTAKEPHIQSFTFNIGLLVVGSLNAAEAATAADNASAREQQHNSQSPAVAGSSPGVQPHPSMATALLPAPDEKNTQQLVGTVQQQPAGSQQTPADDHKQLATAEALASPPTEMPAGKAGRPQGCCL